MFKTTIAATALLAVAGTAHAETDFSDLTPRMKSCLLHVRAQEPRADLTRIVERCHVHWGKKYRAMEFVASRPVFEWSTQPPFDAQPQAVLQ
jgi:hypothetical protein